jgi:alpha-L-fucosidase
MTAEQGGQDLVIPDAIRTLLERRAQYMEWLAKLDDLGGKYRPEVAKRVRADYRTRLTGVEDQLHGHKEELESSLWQRKQQLSEFMQRHEVCAAELEEAELRHQVGEFDEGEWENRKEAHERELADVAGALDVEREAVAELGAVLLQVTSPSEAAATRHVEPGAWPDPGSGNPPADAESTPVVDEQSDGGDTIVDEAATDAVEAADEVLDDMAAAIDEPAELLRAEEVVEQVVVEEPTLTEVPSTEKLGEGDEFLDELEFLESLSLDDPESFDAVSRMLEEGSDQPSEGDGDDRGGAG